MKRYLLNHQLILAFLFIVILAFSILSVCHFITQPLLPVKQPSQTIIFHKDDTLWTFARELHKRHLLAHPYIFILYAKWHSFDRTVKAGEYTIEPGMTPPKLLKKMTKGITDTVQFIEGWTFDQFRKTLKQTPLLQTIEDKSNADIMKQLGSAYKNPEGLFFPDTYAFTQTDSDVDILKRAYERMQEILDSEWKKRKESLPYQNSYQALIVASLIEAEVKLDEEREKVAGVVVRRLEKWMHLQIDAAINYGLSYPYGQKLTKEDLKHDTSYNTYLHYRLPPTPICMPGEKSIHAALHPDDSDALYYVARGDGSHQFSKTYVGQKKAIETYQSEGNAN